MVKIKGGKHCLILRFRSAYPRSSRRSIGPIIGGHIISAVTGVITYTLFGLSWWSAVLGCAFSIVAMLLTKTTHPPGGATGLIAVWTQQSLSFIVAPVAIGAVILVIVGIITNNLSPRRNYPKYWI
ncbi:HPP family protein [Zhaonella formicivorans]|uniref:HPP family protein n=1 Tax=Zhaonella formicivorans TaxID=2528593 RepID=UPI001D119E4A|nr:HPP family protein [Zhaonella formicivorans]